MSRRRYSNRKLYLLFGGAFTLLIIVGILHDIGWLIIAAGILFGTYKAGQRSGLNRRKRSVPRYGPGIRRVHEPRGNPLAYRGGSWPREPVETADVVSAYPPELREPEPAEPAQSRTEPRTAETAYDGSCGRADCFIHGPHAHPNQISRSRLLRDRMSGVRKLWGENDDD